MSSTTPATTRVYLDNAATSWPKPEEVYRAVDDYQRNLGAPAGRSGYAEATAVSQAVERARARLANFVGLADPSHLVFTLNGTDALNMAIHGLLKPGDHVVTTVAEHNSVLRPLAELAEQGMIEVTRVGCDARGVVDPADIQAALRPATRLVVMTQASNVTGALQDVPGVARVAHERGALVLCDAAQSLGHVPVDMTELDVDLLAAPGHKGLLGPLGTGLLAIHPRIAGQLRSIRQGGTGTQSQATRQPDELPYKFESGNLNVPGILGLAAGVSWLEKQGLEAIVRQGQSLTERLITSLSDLPNVRLLGPALASQRVPLVSVTWPDYDPQVLASTLDAAYRVQVRGGLHCAGAMHEALGTQVTGGSLRFSLGPFNTADDLERAIGAMREIVAELSL